MFTVLVTGADGGTPTGVVTFLDGATTLGTAPLVAEGSGGAFATFTTSALSQGQHTITVAYGGDAVYAVSASTGYNQPVSPLASPLLYSGATGPAMLSATLLFAAAGPQPLCNAELGALESLVRIPRPTLAQLSQRNAPPERPPTKGAEPDGADDLQRLGKVLQAGSKVLKGDARANFLKLYQKG